MLEKLENEPFSESGWKSWKVLGGWKSWNVIFGPINSN